MIFRSEIGTGAGKVGKYAGAPIWEQGGCVKKWEIQSLSSGASLMGVLLENSQTLCIKASMSNPPIVLHESMGYIETSQLKIISFMQHSPTVLKDISDISGFSREKLILQ